MGKKIIIRIHQWSLLLTWITPDNFNPSMDKLLYAHKEWDEITYPFLNADGCTVEA